MSWYSFILHAALGAVTSAVKNPKHKAELRDLLLDIRDAISAAYPEQPR